MNSTPFCSTSNYDNIIEITKELKSFGYQTEGYETMYCGMTGKMMQAKVFIGPTYYQRLKHLVKDKIHARGSVGPVQLINLQPRHGRSKEGGLRFGEIEFSLSGIKKFIFKILLV